MKPEDRSVDPIRDPQSPMHDTAAGSISDPGLIKGLLDPVDRISEILFGLIMALTFTCTISVADANREDVRTMLVSAIGCNIAWGFVDAVMYILSGMAFHGRGRRVLRFIQLSKQISRSHEHIADALPPVVTSVLSKDDIELIRKRLLALPPDKLRIRMGWTSVKTALGIFLLVTLTTFPVVLPFIFIPEPRLALRMSNLVAVLLMFVCGWLLGAYGGYSRIWMALAMTILGSFLVGLTILLGG